MKKTILKAMRERDHKQIDFECDTGLGWVQFEEKSRFGGCRWALFLNHKCIHTSKTFNALLNKLNTLLDVQLKDI